MPDTVPNEPTIEEFRCFRPFCPEMHDIISDDGFAEAVIEAEQNPGWWQQSLWN